MDILSKLIGSPINVNDKEVIFIVDRLADDVEDEAYIVGAPETNDKPRSWINEDELSSLKMEYPGVPIYGLWETLYASGLIDADKDIQIIPLNDNDGIFVSVEDGKIIETGEYHDRFFLGHAYISFDDAWVIDPSLDELTLPGKALLTHSEIWAKTRAKKRYHFLVRTVVVGLAVATWAVGDYTFKSFHASKLDDYKAKQEQIKKLQVDYSNLRAKYLLDVVDQELSLSRLMVAAELDKNFSIPTQQVDGETIKVKTTDKVSMDPSKLHPWINSERRQDGGWNLSWRNSER